jgi:2-phosphosulfolactate phosphatase
LADLKVGINFLDLPNFVFLSAQSDRMKIETLQLVEGARQAHGLTIVIDVFRAFSAACYVMGNGAEKIISVGKVETAFQMKAKHPDYLLMGERNERKVEGFDFGNSPTEVEGVNFSGRTVVQTTSAGTQGLVNAVHADEVLTGSFVNAGAIVKYVRNQAPEQVSLVCMGYAARRPIEEDTLCAEYLRRSLLGETPDFDGMTETIRKTSGKRFFLAGHQDHAPSTDFYLCLHLNRFDFILRAGDSFPDRVTLNLQRHES